ncbi:hypothetical protein [Streptomyces lateritius]|uniref:hypothetical protein n=1 Tax=Streptomyces lateritius TaxID=67313 RepID=UPI0016799152|nr:hypothetical protein [Streptomyces lateritius]
MGKLVAKAPESAPVIGIGAGRRVVSVDLDAESPHESAGGRAARVRAEFDAPGRERGTRHSWSGCRAPTRG